MKSLSFGYITVHGFHAYTEHSPPYPRKYILSVRRCSPISLAESRDCADRTSSSIVCIRCNERFRKAQSALSASAVSNCVRIASIYFTAVNAQNLKRRTFFVPLFRSSQISKHLHRKLARHCETTRFFQLFGKQTKELQANLKLRD